MNTPKARYTFLSFLLIAFAVYSSFHSAMPQEATEGKVPKTEFSTVRAFEHVNELAKEPHYVGSKAHETVRNYIISELKKLGLQPSVQEGFTLDGWGNVSKPKNILARIKGKNSSKALLLLSHYDSDPHSAVGASDAASGVATILEGTRAFLAKGKQPENDIILLLSDGEELGLNGAELFVNKHPWAKDVGLVLNFEARGSGGPSIMLLETNNGNAKLIKAFKDAGTQYPVGNSLAYSIYKMLPNDTDLTVFREDGNIQGFNFAFIDDHFDYHTANDTPENLDFNTLAHQGTYLMPLLDYFSTQDLTQMTSEDDLIYFNSPFGFHTYPFSWILPMLILIILLFIGLILYGFKEKMLSGKGILSGFIPFLVALIASCAATILGWKLINWLYPHYGEIQHGFTYNGYTYISLFAFLSLGISFYSYHKFGKKTTAANLSIAPLFFWVVITALAAFYLDGASFISIPVLLSLVSVIILIRNQKQPPAFSLTFLAIPAVVILTPFIKLFPVGLGLEIIAVVALLVVLIIGLLMPVFGLYKRKKWTARLFFFLAIVAFFVAHSNSGFTEKTQKPNSLVYVLDADQNKANWNTYDGILDDWTRNYIKDETIARTKEILDSKYKSGYTYTQTAPVKPIPIPLFETIKDTVHSNLRHVEVKIIPQRNVNRIEVFGDGKQLETLQINGVRVPKIPKLRSRRLVSYYVSDNEPLSLSFTTKPDQKVSFIMYEASFDLLTNPLFTIPARAKNMMPRPFVLNDAVLVKKTIEF
ncbi:M28 family peptidase [Kordia sp. YSTF-M3]|uniref:M28 family peptidase n=1 Tax=Kordia aestuariivivens TaxID=2759037 RepID=A0ABR7QFH1_9FLAO|nr:M28 family peptidase [Kordia aestuariivivens]MBC8757319.1 M28 family peptidase [Kordia aestuariivivens]